MQAAEYVIKVDFGLVGIVFNTSDGSDGWPAGAGLVLHHAIIHDPLAGGGIGCIQYMAVVVEG
jgi:hypothetical protein